MGLRNTPGEWGAVAKLFHWSIALFILTMIALGWTATLWPLNSSADFRTKLDLFAWHKSLGMIILTLVAFRLLWRLMNPVPALAEATPAVLRYAAHCTHWLFYALLVIMPVSGYIIHSTADLGGVDNDFTILGLVTVPKLLATNEALSETAETVHYFASWVLVAAVTVHVAAALKHHLVDKDDTLTRMLPGSSQR